MERKQYTVQFFSGILFEFVHKGPCGTGSKWECCNTEQDTILGCRNECDGKPGVGYFSYNQEQKQVDPTNPGNRKNCACYLSKDGCHEDTSGLYPYHDSYRIVKPGYFRRQLYSTLEIIHIFSMYKY